MYSACIFCHSALGQNEAVEQFPVGRRLAFDAAKGRLWVICTSCARWNLTPLDERWEAIESCERLFRDTRTRLSTDNVGLARLRDGTDLVRVGAPQRPEMAAWRYGETFGQRRRNYQLVVGGGVIIAAGFYSGLIAMGGTAFIGSGIWSGMTRLYERATAVRLRDGHTGSALTVTATRAGKARFFLDTGTNDVALSVKAGGVIQRYDGESALRAAAQLFPKVNASGAKGDDVAQAVDVLERAARSGTPSLTRQLLLSHRTERSSIAPVTELSPSVRLALEMSLHEDAERAAMEGELMDLEDRWREAEEIAAISDNLLLPEGVVKALARLRGR